MLTSPKMRYEHTISRVILNFFLKPSLRGGVNMKFNLSFIFFFRDCIKKNKKKENQQKSLTIEGKCQNCNIFFGKDSFSFFFLKNNGRCYESRLNVHILDNVVCVTGQILHFPDF